MSNSKRSRALRRTRSRSAFIGAAVVLALAIIGCGPTTTAKPSAAPTASPSASTLPTAVPKATPRIGKFQASALMNGNRSFATATLLNDGRVLIAGGVAYGLPVATAEIFDPATGAFALTGSMTEARARHTASLLPNGKVLIAGGNGNGTAEVYSPSTGKFTRTNPMKDSAIYQTAITLRDGRVLLAGGRIGDVYTSNAQIYKVATGKFSRARSLKDPREHADATLLQDGRVLISGGDQGDSGKNAVILASAEIFNPTTGYFTRTASMADARSHFTATLLANGKVLVVGGINRTSNMGLLATAELYDPVTGKWSRTGSMTFGRSDFAATLLADGRVLVAGGGDNSAELYDPATGNFVPAGKMVMARLAQTATPLEDTRVLIAGGNDATLAELYSP